ncbi:hypothetical protein Dalk_1126 [Desulfatibacillum aliphaticivorans]|uniref:Periplasmic heavy metal sensor n=1 Tax=Desulfatibacillum aliphaticivorans TaxID=218208 RepID=B8F983_DESAL|nr:periplasmic heavy metal sensor [Desulfatibacillum aliphaticivorans]ACL02829.1 hypothetical protein Dalk_1126 [Desulfatibacillum aliphaticivorans]
MKMKTKKMPKILGILVLSMVLGGFLFAGCRDNCRFNHDPEVVALRVEKGLDRALSKLKADEAQQEEIHGIAQLLLEDALTVKQRAKNSRSAMVETLLAEEIDREALHQQLDEQIRLMTEFAHRTADKLADMSAVLTVEQRDALLEHIKAKQEECF